MKKYGIRGLTPERNKAISRLRKARRGLRKGGYYKMQKILDPVACMLKKTVKVDDDAIIPRANAVASLGRVHNNSRKLDLKEKENKNRERLRKKLAACCC